MQEPSAESIRCMTEPSKMHPLNYLTHNMKYALKELTIHDIFLRGS